MAEQNPSRFIDALNRRPVDRTPIWLMRQAGRYLPEYRKVRAQAGNFLKLCQTPELACEVTLQPLARFALDAAIIFSDILVIPEAMGLGLHFVEGEGPCFEKPVRAEKDIANLPIPDPQRDLSYVLEAIRLTAHELKGKTPLIGFCGSPWTVATYMVEGKASKTHATIKAMLYDEPKLCHALLDKITEASILYLKAQIQSGAKAVMVFDTWGGVLNERAYQAFSLAKMQNIVSALKNDETTQNTPIILFTKNGGQWLEDIAATGCDGVGVDWTQNLHKARMRVGDKVAIQGNLDPCVLYANPTKIQQEVKLLLEDFGQGTGHIFNLGHGLHPDMNPDHVKALVDAVVSYSPAFHSKGA